MSGTPAQFRGQCSEPDCCGDYAIRKDGTVREHWDNDSWGGKDARVHCPGSKRKPIRIWQRNTDAQN